MQIDSNKIELPEIYMFFPLTFEIFNKNNFFFTIILKKIPEKKLSF